MSSSTVTASLFLGTNLRLTNGANVSTLTASQLNGTNLSANSASVGFLNAGSVVASTIVSNNYAGSASLTSLFSSVGSFNSLKASLVYAGTFNSSSSPIDDASSLVVAGPSDAKLLIRGRLPGSVSGIDFEPTGAYNGNGNTKSLSIMAINDGSSSAHMQVSQRYPGTITNTVRPTLFLQSNGYLGINKVIPSYTLDVDGDVSSSNNVYASNFITTSDRNVKTDIRPVVSALERVQMLQGVSFRMKDDEKSKLQIGLIAQEVEKAGLSEFVHELKDGTKGVDYAKMVALLIEAIKSQQKQIDALETRK